MKVLAQQVSHDLLHPQDKRRFGGLIEVELLPDLAPKHVESFLNHVKNKICTTLRDSGHIQW